MEEEKLVSDRLKKLGDLFKKNYSWAIYVALALVVYAASWIRTRGLSGLRDVTTGGWTLGPDLDPFLFLRWARYIVEHGHIMTIDYMRNAPLGIATNLDFTTHSYFIAWFHQLAVFFGSTSVEQSAVLYPVFIFCLGAIFIFLFLRKAFTDSIGKLPASIIGIVAAFFTTVIPVLLPRTVAGIPDKQGTFVFFLFFSLYFFLCAWKAKSYRNQLILSVVAGIATGIFSIVWGGGWLTALVVAPSALIYFLLGGIDRKKTYVFLIWLIIPQFFLLYFSARYNIHLLLTSFYTGLPILIGIFLAIHTFVYEPYVAKRINTPSLQKIPDRTKSIIFSAIIMFIIGIIAFGPTYVFRMILTVLSLLISPAPTDRFNLTVAQNRVPYLSEITESFGPYIGSFPIFFIIFLLGSVYLVYKTVVHFGKKESFVITSSYAFMIFAVLMSRYDPSSTFNGETFASHLLYGLGMLLFLGSSAYTVWKMYQEGKEENLKNINFSYIIILVLFFLTLISVKGAVRLVLLLVPSASIMAAYFVVEMFRSTKENTDSSLKNIKITLGIITLILLFYAGYTFFNQSAQTAQAYVPSLYTHQWQYAMDWVRHNTTQTAVFAHWWDYGYWLQSIGNRSTVLDGGNQIVYWDFLMGRYALTGKSNQDALNFLYSHNTTHFLIDSTDIGKYAAYASIGSDQNYDRYSFIPTMLVDPTQVQERKNSTVYLFRANSPVDADIIYNDNGTNVFLPSSNSAIIGIIIERNKNDSSLVQPFGVYYYQNKQYNLPLRYAFSDNKLIDFGKGLDAGIYLMPGISAQGQQLAIAKDQALLYLSPRTVHSQMVRLYLFKENNSNFQLVHSEDDLVVAMLKSQNYLDKNTDIVLDQSPYSNARGNGLAGPIKIWNITYPTGMVVNQTDLLLDFQDQSLTQSR